MKHVVNPKDTSRAKAFELWMSSPMPMVTLTKTFDVTCLYRIAKRKGLSFNMLLCWCIGTAASQIEEFYTLPEQGQLFNYDRLAINVIVNNIDGGISSCDIPFTDDLDEFSTDYFNLTQSAKKNCASSFQEDMMVIGTSAVTATELDSIVNQYTDQFCNPMVMWGRYCKKWLKVTLPISFQFHHVQMDGGHAARFLEDLQKVIKSL